MPFLQAWHAFLELCFLSYLRSGSNWWDMVVNAGSASQRRKGAVTFGQRCGVQQACRILITDTVGKAGFVVRVLEDKRCSS